MAPDYSPSIDAPAEEAPAQRDKDHLASFCARIPHLSTGHRAALRRLFLTQSEQAVGVVTGLLLASEVPEPAWRDPLGFARWQLLAHAAAVLSGTEAVAPHRRGVSLGRALHQADYSDNRLMRLTSARGPALVDQIVRAVRVLAAKGIVPVDLRTLHALSADAERADAARLRIARDYYAAAHASTKEAP